MTHAASNFSKGRRLSSKLARCEGQETVGCIKTLDSGIMKSLHLKMCLRMQQCARPHAAEAIYTLNLTEAADMTCCDTCTEWTKTDCQVIAKTFSYGIKS